MKAAVQEVPYLSARNPRSIRALLAHTQRTGLRTVSLRAVVGVATHDSLIIIATDSTIAIIIVVDDDKDNARHRRGFA